MTSFRPFYLCENNNCSLLPETAMLCPAQLGFQHSYFCKHDRGYIDVLVNDTHNYRTVPCDISTNFTTSKTIYNAVYTNPFMGAVRFRSTFHHVLSCLLEEPHENIDIGLESHNDTNAIYKIGLPKKYSNLTDTIQNLLKNSTLYEGRLLHLEEIQLQKEEKEKETSDSQLWYIITAAMGTAAISGGSLLACKYCHTNPINNTSPLIGARSPHVTQLTNHILAENDVFHLDKLD